MASIYSIGHSTRPLGDLIVTLQTHHIRTLVDIRAFPMSRRFPHFNRESLQEELPKLGIDYVWMKDLGGRRNKQRDDSPNVALRNPAFRNYADYMLTTQFQKAAEGVVRLADQAPTAIMCAERVYFRCHRMLVSDYFTLHGHDVLHIDDAKPPRPHKVMEEARLVEDEVIYHGDRLF